MIERVSDIEPSRWPVRWPQVRLDQFVDLNKMQVSTMDALNALCDIAESKHGWTHHINSGYREGDTGQHGFGLAVDVVFYHLVAGDTSPIDQFVFAVGTGLFRRVGFYLDWKSPGLHLDLKNETLCWFHDTRGYHYGKSPAGILTARVV